MSLDERSLDERIVEAGVTLEQLERLCEIWGLASPLPGQTSRLDDLRLLDVIGRFRGAGIDPGTLVEATRYLGELTRRIAEGLVQFFRARVIVTTRVEVLRLVRT